MLLKYQRKSMNVSEKHILSRFDVLTRRTEFATAVSLCLVADNGIFDHIITYILTRTLHEKETPQFPLTIHNYIRA